jgi:hypothetical protein
MTSRFPATPSKEGPNESPTIRCSCLFTQPLGACCLFLGLSFGVIQPYLIAHQEVARVMGWVDGKDFSSCV